MKTQVLLIFQSVSRDHVHSIEHDIRKRIEILAKLVSIFHHSIQHDKASGYTFYQ